MAGRLVTVRELCRGDHIMVNGIARAVASDPYPDLWVAGGWGVRIETPEYGTTHSLWGDDVALFELVSD